MEDWYKSLLLSLLILFSGAIITFLASRISRLILGRLASRTVSKTDDFIVDVIISTIKPLGLIISISIAWCTLPFNNEVDSYILGISKFIGLVLIVRMINRIVLRVINRWTLKINDKAISTMLESLRPMIRAIIWCLGIIFYLQNMGVQMAAIWALLSAGGIGAGLALKEPVQEFFEYITILLDKPFQSGEFINVGGVWATVDRVGVRSTRLKSLNGEIIVMSNSNLTNGIISNYAEMKTRRIVHKLGVIYQTPLQQMKAIPIIIKSIVDDTSDAEFDRCHFIEFGESSLDFELVYYIPNNNYTKAMDAQQKINLSIMEKFESESIEFAYPTRTINLFNS